MALGLPVITTKVGLEGLHCKPEQEILVAENPDEFIKQIFRLQSNSEFARLLSINAYRYVLKNHSWSEKVAPVVTSINNLIKN